MDPICIWSIPVDENEMIDDVYMAKHDCLQDMLSVMVILSVSL